MLLLRLLRYRTLMDSSNGQVDSLDRPLWRICLLVTIPFLLLLSRVLRPPIFVDSSNGQVDSWGGGVQWGDVLCQAGRPGAEY